MDAWKRIGAFIGSHMAFFSPFGVLVGVLFPEQLGVLKPLVTPAFAFFTFQGALNNDFDGLRHTLRHPAPMFVTLLISCVLVPVGAYLGASLFFGSNPNLVCGILIEYCIPVAVVSSMWVTMLAGDLSLALATIVVSTLIAPVTIPVTLQLLVGQAVEVDAASMVLNLGVSIALPALVGTTANDLSHGRASRVVSPVLAPAARMALIAVIAINSTGVAPYLRNLTAEHVGVLAFVLAYSSVGYLVGLLVARAWKRDRATLVTMTFQGGMRNISAGAVIAAEYFPPEVMFPVMAGTLFQQVLAAGYGNLIGRLAGPAPEEGSEA